MTKQSKRIGLLERKKQNIEDFNYLYELIEYIIKYEDFEELTETDLLNYKQQCDEYEDELLYSNKQDSNPVYLTIHAGAGGTEAEDWATMLYRMYNMWSKKNGYSFNVLDSTYADDNRIKAITIEIDGDYPYGNLKGESGVHRLVRISPFNAQGKRQTSFASINVTPQVNDDIVVNINEKDLKIDVYRSGGKGGQSVNVTDSAVRITHIPTKIIVTCQNERSQIQNKAQAMKVLKSRLYAHYEQIKQAELDGKEVLDNGWGNQIRSYVFHPYQMVKDHRTDCEVGSVSNVMDGDLDKFIKSYLRNIQE